ncbi:DNA mismatch repair endonuclease MutL [Cytophagaceae bacterium ABcell3]|nr:DNA mismatch repair endonuclease MutL [Cytophagaceae bacterium ABcell3]
MSDIIKLLPDALANQIAAGEVVQRPSSVVKELLENSIDAGSTRITLIVKEAGKQLIQVVDDGKGMTETDARMCFERHATSKISSTEDLFCIRTMGFRGEAMASIAAVAQVELKSCARDSELGTLLKVEGSEVKVQEPVATPEGTSISVKNLFFNVPARRNFLKSNPVEMKHILDEFQRVALANPEISFSLIQNDLEVYNLPSEKLSRRIISLFGNSYKEQLIPCQEETEMVKIHGYAGKPENARKTRGEQFFFVNDRFIRNNYLHHAVMSAYENLLPDDHFPFYVLFIEIDPRHIDINVHPTKTEIKFDDERTVYAIMRACVKKALGTHNITPSIDFDQDVNFKLLTGASHQSFSMPETNFSSGGSSPASGGGSFRPDKGGASNWEMLYQNFETSARPEFSQDMNDEEGTQQEMITFESKANSMRSNSLNLVKELLNPENDMTFQLHNRYIVAQIKSGMVIVDQQAAHERILYEKFVGMMENRSGASQQFLFPQKLELNPADFALVTEMEEEIKGLGFVYEVFGNNTIVINGTPADVSPGNEKGLFENLIEQFKFNKSELKLDKRENLARSLAKKAALRPGTKLSVTEMNTLIDQLFACKNPSYAPNGNHTIVVMDMNKIAGFFNKKPDHNV